VAIPLQGIELHRTLGIIKRRGAELGRTARRFLQLLKEHSAGFSCHGEVTASGHDNGRIGKDATVRKQLAETMPASSN
jgi:hypothetical protein